MHDPSAPADPYPAAQALLAAPGERPRTTIELLLETARALLDVDVAWLSRFTGAEQVLTHVTAKLGAVAPEAGASTPLSGSYCVRVLDGRLPAVVHDTRADARTRDLEVTTTLGIGAYAGVPIRRPDGTVHGMLCATSSEARSDLGERDVTRLRLLAGIVAGLLDADDAPLAERRERVIAAVDGVGRSVALQPIVDVTTGVAVGVEALARFETAPYRPDHWFAEAEAVGLRLPLELAAARSALRAVGGQDGYVSINLSPATIVAGGLDVLLTPENSAGVVVEVTEHAAVGDYAALKAALAPHRAVGVRLAIDDAGAGYASFRHILELCPDYIKVDQSLVRDIDADPVRQALTSSMLSFARSAGATVIAEGVETQAELDTLARLGVPLVQGYLLGRPEAAPRASGYARPSRHIAINGGTDLSIVLAEALRAAPDAERVARPLLDAVLAITGLETSYVTERRPDGQLELRYVRNAGTLKIEEGSTVPWSTSPCALMHDKGLMKTASAPSVLAESPLLAALGVMTYVTVPMIGGGGEIIGTVCAASRSSVHISDTTVAQLQLIAHVIGSVSGQEAV